MANTTNQKNEVRQNATENGTKIFVNLPVSDLKKTMNFFSNLGFTFNPMFTNADAAGMVIGQDIDVLLLVETFFKDFIPGKETRDTKNCVEANIALSANTRKEVDELIRQPIAPARSGRRQAMV